MNLLGESLVGREYAQKDVWAVIYRQELFGLPLWPQLEALAQRHPQQTLVLYRSPLPFAALLVQRAGADCLALTPRDSETRVFLGDIPLIDLDVLDTGSVRQAMDRHALLTSEGLCLVVTEQPMKALLYAACLHHALYVTYLADLIDHGPQVDGEEKIASVVQPLAHPLAQPAPLSSQVDRTTLANAGQQMVQRGLVDSVFGNASFRDGHQILISGTGIALDQLAQGTVQVHQSIPGASDAKASSELPSHRAIYAATDARVILHGHSRFAVALSLTGEDAIPDAIPKVHAPPGSQQMGDDLAEALQQSSLAMVQGHGPFAVGQTFNEALISLIDFENHCRERYLQLLSARLTL